jgi:hypothetical protein
METDRIRDAMKMTELEKKAAKPSGLGNEAGNKESETATIIPEEACTTTTVEAIFRIAFYRRHPKLFRMVRRLTLKRDHIEK